MINIFQSSTVYLFLAVNSIALSLLLMSAPMFLSGIPTSLSSVDLLSLFPIVLQPKYQEYGELPVPTFKEQVRAERSTGIFRRLICDRHHEWRPYGSVVFGNRLVQGYGQGTPMGLATRQRSSRQPTYFEFTKYNKLTAPRTAPPTDYYVSSSWDMPPTPQLYNIEVISDDEDVEQAPSSAKKQYP
ncbi:hypothetical protein LTR37_008960 [Vermiconidia calcicola]|uniref:Uncharacterized protein n=1 Tax=Vermiconidia calcicola TaxID=1690605 RepID=A0ACC3N9T3_9PEZI|nr:hypothetical protein LTR37_008960 [Vermiconidia calcicola]